MGGEQGRGQEAETEKMRRKGAICSGCGRQTSRLRHPLYEGNTQQLSLVAHVWMNPSSGN